jgi:outer membrane protein assembly factor BamA
MKFHSSLRKLPFLFVWLTLVGTAQEDPHPYEISAVRFRGNETFNNSKLQTVIRSRESPMWLWKFLYRSVSENLGEQPEYFDALTFASDFHQLGLFYREHGFYNVEIDTSLVLDKSSWSADLTFNIREGGRSIVDTIRIRGLDGIETGLRKQIDENRLISTGDAFSVEIADAELRRIVATLANNGHVLAKVDSVGAFHYASTNNVTLLYSFIPGEQFRFGSITIGHDSTSRGRVDDGTILQQLDFRQGDVYSEVKKIQSERNLNRIGVFEVSKVEPVVKTNGQGDLSVPMAVTVRTRDFQELTPEIGFNDEDNTLNIVTGLGYNHRNLFGGARNFLARFRYSLISIEEAKIAKLFNEQGLRDPDLRYKADFSLQLIQPYFITNRISLTSAFSAILDKQTQYYVPIYRVRFGVNTRASEFNRLFVDWDLEYSNPTRIDSTFIITTIDYKQQFNSIISLAIQWDRRNDLFTPTQGYFHSISIEQAGLLATQFVGLFGTPLPFSEYIKISPSALWYWNPDQRGILTWAFKARAGAAYVYGDPALDVPVTRRFRSGGSSSVRGWLANELGAVPNPVEGGKATVESSLEARWNPLKTAGAFYFIDLNKISFVFFLDAGNVWTDPIRVRLSELGWAAGVGFRYNTIAGPIRIDLGWKVHDPAGVPLDGKPALQLGVGHAF